MYPGMPLRKSVRLRLWFVASFFLVDCGYSASLPPRRAQEAPQQQQQQTRSGTPEEQKACAHDVQKFCRSLMDQSDLIVLNCLQQNRTKLTKACDLVLVKNGQ